MSRSIVFLAAMALVLASTITFASLYSWNEAKRPPITLSDALARAEKLLGDDAPNRYCVSVSLFGDDTGAGKHGAWNLLFAAADGSKKHVYINMQGRSDVKLWNGPIDWNKQEGRRIDLDDVRRRLEELFKNEGIAPEIHLRDDVLLLTHRTREFQVYSELADGGYANQLQQVPGPAADGIWLKMRLTNQVDRREYGFNEGPYWRWVRGTYFLTQPGQFLSVDFRYGSKVSDRVVTQIWDTFGEPTPK